MSKSNFCTAESHIPRYNDCERMKVFTFICKVLNINKQKFSLSLSLFFKKNACVMYMRDT
jgi:hypothetical protein